MRKKIADGTALPDEIAEFERTSRERAELVEQAVPKTAEFVIADRDKKLMVAGMWSGLYAVAKAVRDAGFSGEDFNPDNAI